MNISLLKKTLSKKKRRKKIEKTGIHSRMKKVYMWSAIFTDKVPILIGGNCPARKHPSLPRDESL